MLKLHDVNDLTHPLILWQLYAGYETLLTHMRAVQGLPVSEQDRQHISLIKLTAKARIGETGAKWKAPSHWITWMCAALVPPHTGLVNVDLEKCDVICDKQFRHEDSVVGMRAYLLEQHIALRAETTLAFISKYKQGSVSILGTAAGWRTVLRDTAGEETHFAPLRDLQAAITHICLQATTRQWTQED